MRYVGAAVVAFGLAAAGGTSAHAAAPALPGARDADADREADAAPADVTVTGQRQPYLGDVPLRTLPQAVQTLDAATLDTAGLRGLQTALDFVAGVARQNNLGGLFDGYAIRGFAGDENLAGNYLLNGFNASRGYGGPRDAANIERIEVVKGPTSALFGRGDPGGVVNIVTKKPFFGTGGHVEASVGRFAARRVEADVDTAFGDTVAVRVTGAHDAGDSFRDTVHRRVTTVTPSVLWRPDAATSLSYELEYVRQALPFDRGVVAVDGVLGRVPRSRFLGEPGDGDIVTRALGHQAQLQHDLSSRWSLLLGGSYRTSRLRGFATEAENSDARQTLFGDGRTLSRQRRHRDYATTDLTVRGELTGRFATGGIDHRLQIGGDWDRFTLDQRVARFRPPAVAQQTTPAAGNAIDIFAPGYGRLAATAPFLDSAEEDEAGGLYAQDMIDVTRWLVVRAGGRVDRFAQRIADRLGGSVRRQRTTAFSPQMGVSIVPSPAVTLYGGYGEGFRPNTGVDATGAALAPERTRAWEAGTKLTAPGGRLSATLALFTMRRDNVPTADPVNSGFSLAIGQARSRGVEASATGTLPGGVRLILNYAYVDATIARDAIDPNLGFAVRAGDRLINVPRHSGSALVEKAFALGGRQASLGIAVNHVGRRVGQTGYRDADGDPFLLPAYTLVGLNGTVALSPRLRLAANVANLFDRTYYASSYSRVWVMPGSPRQATARLRYSF